MGEGAGCAPRDWRKAEKVKERGVATKRPGDCDPHRKTVCERCMNKHEPKTPKCFNCAPVRGRQAAAGFSRGGKGPPPCPAQRLAQGPGDPAGGSPPPSSAPVWPQPRPSPWGPAVPCSHLGAWSQGWDALRAGQELWTLAGGAGSRFLEPTPSWADTRDPHVPGGLAGGKLGKTETAGRRPGFGGKRRSPGHLPLTFGFRACLLHSYCMRTGPESFHSHYPV